LAVFFFFFFCFDRFYSLTTFTLVKYSSTKIFLGGRLYKENNQKNCTIIHILFFYACLILNTFQVMLAVFFFFFGCFIIDDDFFFKIFQDLNLKGGCWSMIDNWMGWSKM
jgi:isoprenylcysteine carboxyl methyltransferase (ICMT) family protein YpbQ